MDRLGHVLGRLGSFLGRLRVVLDSYRAVLGRLGPSWKPPCRDAEAVQAGSGSPEKATRGARKKCSESRGPIYIED